MPKSSSKNLWASRFSGGVADLTLRYTETATIDQAMVRHDIVGSLAHCMMLAKQNIISKTTAAKINRQLLALLRLAEQGKIKLDIKNEDVHMHIEKLLIDKLGVAVGGQLHTARSRNDQVMTTTRLYMREQVLAVAELANGLIAILLKKAAGETKTLMLGYTHSQPAQPISFAYWLSGHATALTRDIDRLLWAYTTVNQSPLGAGALAGTSFPIDRKETARLLGFEDVMVHALDATSARDFLVEVTAALTMVMTNLSRLCEEIVWWSSNEFGLFEVADEFATGSSMMPQKKNPIVAEVMRGRAGTVHGCLVELLTVLKSVSFGYSSDLQQDKPPVWRALETVQASLTIMTAMMTSLTFRAKRAEARCWDSFVTATELANYLVRTHKLAFRQAYGIVGGAVKQLSAEHTNFKNLKRLMELLNQHGIQANAASLADAVDPLKTLLRQTSLGSTGPGSVKKMLISLQKQTGDFSRALQERRSEIDAAVKKIKRMAT